MKPKNGSASIRKGRTSLAGHIYHVTLPVENRVQVFSIFENANLMRLSLKASDDLGHTETLCYCIMPDHIHWLFEFKSSSLSQCISRVKAQYSRLSNSKIWQDGFHDHAIRSDESLINIARYIVANPLRAGLIKSVAQYNFWDSCWIDG